MQKWTLQVDRATLEKLSDMHIAWVSGVSILAEIHPIEVTHYTVALFEYLTIMEVNGTMKHIVVFGFTYFEDERSTILL